MPKSAVIRMLDLVWDNTNTATGHSWERLNHAMRDALTLTIGSGFKFATGDVSYIFSNYRSGRWIGESEWIYRDAILSDNMSAIKSFEACKGREPFIAENVNRNSHSHAFKHGGGGEVEKSRLAVGFSFPWQGQVVKVTSWSRNQLSLTACSYKKVKGERYGNGKIDKRYTITREELLAGRAMDRERRSLLERAENASSEAIPKIKRALKLKSRDQFMTLPIERLREVIDKHAPKPPRPPRGTFVEITQAHIDRAVSAGGNCQARKYKPGQRSSKITDKHREWLFSNVPDLYAELFPTKAEKVA